MNITRVLLGVATAVALIVGCGDDSDNSNASKFASCTASASGSPSNKCSSCQQSKCADVQAKCFGANYSGGLCADYLSCASKAADPCHPANCPFSGSCLSCVMNDLSSCVLTKCASDCGVPSGLGSDAGGGGANGAGASPGTGALPGTGATGAGSGTCADLQKCCVTVTKMSAMAGDSCDMLVTEADGNDAICSAALSGLKAICP